MWWQHTLVALLLGTEVQFCNTSDGNAPCHCIAYDRVRVGHFINSIWSKDVGGTFCSSVCKFLIEHALWCPTGWTDWLWTETCHWCVVSVRWHCDGSCWDNLKGQSLDPEDDCATISQNIIHCSPDDTVSHAVRLEPSVCHPRDDPKSHKCWLISPVRINTTCHILYISERVPLPVPAYVTV